MKILVLNCGSSSLKYQLFSMTNETVLAKGLVERIGMDDAILTHRPTGKKLFRDVQPLFEHGAAIKVVTNALTDPEHGVIQDINEIKAVGHRVVHGGEDFHQSTLISADVKKAIERCIELAPLHNPPNLKGISATEKALPDVPQVAVFDTAFHATIPSYAYLYPLPYSLYKRYKIRRYGFHGTSHKFVSLKAAQMLQTDITSLKMITCHLGNGASLTAVNHGKSVDTSMGFTPLEGLMMGTRSGDIDPAILPFLMTKEDISLREVDCLLNKHSGLLGISGLSSDMRDLQSAAAENNAQAKEALEMYRYRIQKYIGAYTAAMDGVDVIVFTAGIGENSPDLRERVCQRLTYLGVELDAARNRECREAGEVSTPTSKVKILVIPTNEELMIARETQECYKEARA